jgi:hypothetical protein
MEIRQVVCEGESVGSADLWGQPKEARRWSYIINCHGRNRRSNGGGMIAVSLSHSRRRLLHVQRRYSSRNPRVVECEIQSQSSRQPGADDVTSAYGPYGPPAAPHIDRIATKCITSAHLHWPMERKKLFRSFKISEIPKFLCRSLL